MILEAANDIFHLLLLGTSFVAGISIVLSVSNLHAFSPRRFAVWPFLPALGIRPTKCVDLGLLKALIREKRRRHFLNIVSKDVYIIESKACHLTEK